MNVLLPLWVALILFCCYGNIRSDNGQEEEGETSMKFQESSVTPTPDYDYDYNATFDYYYVTFNQSRNLTQEEGTTMTSQDSSVTPTPDYNTTFDYYYGNRSDNGQEEEGETSMKFQESSVTPTPDYDYDYNATFDYYYVTFNQSRNLTQSSADQDTTNKSSADQETTTKMTSVWWFSPEQVRNSCRSLTHHSWIITTLLVSLAAHFH